MIISSFYQNKSKLTDITYTVWLDVIIFAIKKWNLRALAWWLWQLRAPVKIGSNKAVNAKSLLSSTMADRRWKFAKIHPAEKMHGWLSFAPVCVLIILCRKRSELNMPTRWLVSKKYVKSADCLIAVELAFIVLSFISKFINKEENLKNFPEIRKSNF